MTELPDPPKRRQGNPSMKKFDDLEQFESHIKDESWDNDFDFINAHVDYIPPFIMNEIHNNPEKIKDTMNNHSKKFVRNLHHHVDKHLLANLNTVSGIDYHFDKPTKESLGDKLVWHYKDEGDHGFPDSARRWKVELDVSCNGASPNVSVDMKSIPVTDDMNQ